MTTSLINNMAAIDSGRTSSVMSELFELPATTWTVIQSCCPEKEANEVKRVIGHSLVEEACDLHTEVREPVIYKLYCVYT